MIWAKVAIVGGLLLLAAGFELGTDAGSASVTVGARSFSCGSVIPSSWLVSGTPDDIPARTVPRTQLERGAVAHCRATVHRTQLATWSAFGLGCLAVLIGWTALRERARPVQERTLSALA